MSKRIILAALAAGSLLFVVATCTGGKPDAKTPEKEYPTVVGKIESNHIHRTSEEFIPSKDIDNFIKKRSVLILAGDKLDSVSIDQTSHIITLNKTTQLVDAFSHACHFKPVNGTADRTAFDRAAKQVFDDKASDNNAGPSAGVAVIIHENGYLLTAAHVIDSKHVVACVFKDKRIEQRQIRTLWVSKPADLMTHYKPLYIPFCACFCLNKHAMIIS